MSVFPWTVFLYDNAVIANAILLFQKYLSSMFRYILPLFETECVIRNFQGNMIRFGPEYDLKRNCMWV